MDCCWHMTICEQWRFGLGIHIQYQCWVVNCLIKTYLLMTTGNLCVGQTNSWNNTKKPNQCQERRSKYIMAFTICSSLERSDVICFKWRSLQVTSLLLPSASHFKWRHLSKFFKNFFLLYFGILGNFTSFRADGKRSDVTWSNRHLKQMTSLLSSDDQMVEAFD